MDDAEAEPVDFEPYRASGSRRPSAPHLDDGVLLLGRHTWQPFSRLWPWWHRRPLRRCHHLSAVLIVA